MTDEELAEIREEVDALGAYIEESRRQWQHAPWWREDALGIRAYKVATALLAEVDALKEACAVGTEGAVNLRPRLRLRESQLSDALDEAWERESRLAALVRDYWSMQIDWLRERHQRPSSPHFRNST